MYGWVGIGRPGLQTRATNTEYFLATPTMNAVRAVQPMLAAHAAAATLQGEKQRGDGSNDTTPNTSPRQAKGGIHAIGGAVRASQEEPTPLLRTLVLRLVEVNQLKTIDIVSQCFTAEFVIQLAFEGGALDEHLSNPSDEFPTDQNGRPTFRPSASWYMNQVDFNNALDYKTIDAKVVRDGDDLVMLLRFEGTFSEEMELDDFPCDEQDLTMSLAFNVRTSGMMPLRIVTSPSLETHMPRHYVDGKKWALRPTVAVEPTETGHIASRRFPGLDMRMRVRRNPKFYLLNLGLPMAAFVPMAALQFCVPRDFIAERLGVSLAIVLTAIAHKYSMTALVPPVSTLTVLDWYVLLSLSIICIITLQGGLIGAMESYYCRRQTVFGVAADSGEQASSGKRRRLIGGGTSSAGGTSSTNAGASVDSGLSFERQPVAYNDGDCPYSGSGPFNKFDYIDNVCCGADMILWILLQVWVYWRLRRAQSRLQKHDGAVAARQQAQGGASAAQSL